MRVRACFFLLSCLLFALLSGCSTFERDWELAGQASIASAPSSDRLAGRWKGLWKSDVNGHEGELRCIITRSEKGQYSANYRALWGAGFSFEYTVLMETSEEDKGLNFTGSANLGWFAGGVYQYEGNVTGEKFTSTYSSKADHGVFDMTRT